MKLENSLDNLEQIFKDEFPEQRISVRDLETYLEINILMEHNEGFQIDIKKPDIKIRQGDYYDYFQGKYQWEYFPIVITFDKEKLIDFIKIKIEELENSDENLGKHPFSDKESEYYDKKFKILDRKRKLKKL
jgi:hypothetical protein